MKNRASITPLLIMQAKRLVHPDDVQITTFQVLAALDAAKRSQGTNQNCNLMTEHLLIACSIWTKLKNRTVYDKTVMAWNALLKAAERPTELLNLTTGEYKLLSYAFSAYLKQLPKVEIATLGWATMTAQKSLETMRK